MSAQHNKICHTQLLVSGEEWAHQTNGMIIALAFMNLTALYYLWNIGAVAISLFNNRGTKLQDTPPRKPKRERKDLSTNPLSALLACGFGIVIIFSTWPQSLEAAAVLVAVLAQASLLGWQDHDPERLFKDLIEKYPDVAGVIVAAYALYFGRTVYKMRVPDNTWVGAHDPYFLIQALWRVTAGGCAVGTVQQCWIHFINDIKWKQRLLLGFSVPWVALQLVLVAYAGKFVKNSTDDGCAVFNAAKINGIVLIGVGLLYSFAICLARLRTNPLHGSNDIKKRDSFANESLKK